MPHCPACNASVEVESTLCASCGAPFLEPAYGVLESRLSPQAEAALPVPKWVPVLLGLLGVGGAAIGFVALLLSFQHSQAKPGVAEILLHFIPAALYVLGAYAGVKALQRTPGWLRINQVFWAIQVPGLVSPLVSYMFAAGGLLTVWLQLYPPIHLGFNVQMGSAFAIKLFTPGKLVLGVNLFAPRNGVLPSEARAP